MNKVELDALHRVVDYNWDDEAKHYQEEGEPEDHIFNYMKILADYGQVQQFKYRGK